MAAEPQAGPIPPGTDRTVAAVKHEYLDHTADVQLHAWGDSLAEAFENAAMAMFGYMTEIDSVDMEQALEIVAEAEDLDGLLFHFLDEFLFAFSADPFFIPRKVVITEFDRENFRIRARGLGEQWREGKHPQGTEVKAVTYGSMQIYDDDEKNQHELFVIIDI
jgi:SHS2 domain-containing protein